MLQPCTRLVRLAVVALLLALPALAQTTGTPCFPQKNCSVPGSGNTTNKINYVMYFNSLVHDKEGCSGATVQNGKVVFPARITNPAMSCPDAFSWKLYAEVIRDQWWTRWGTDTTVWPASPYALCTGAPGANCCDPNSLTQNPQNCPLFPGGMTTTATAMPIPVGVPPSKPHLPGFMAAAMERRAPGDENPDRVIRQSMTEVVYRNEPFVRFVRQNNLYNTNGLINAYNRNAANIPAGAPYRLTNQVANVAEIDFPPDAIMIKSDWIVAKYAAQYGIRESPDAPFIKMTILASDPTKPGSQPAPQECWLLAIHVSSKDIPQWVWTTFEHLTNPGRCDYIGCNDSFGFQSPDAVCTGQAKNYTRPNTICDGLDSPAWIFNRDKGYPSGPITPALDGIFNALGIGTSAYQPPPAGGTIVPSPRDRAWRSYRLKGSQTEFVDTMGRTTLLGNSITEAGFMLTSSCVSCHARATVNQTGGPPLGVFTNTVDDQGYLQSVNGIPNNAWYHTDAQPPALTALQTDFVWGFLNASAIVAASPSAAAAPAAKPSPRDIIRGVTKKN